MKRLQPSMGMLALIVCIAIISLWVVTGESKTTVTNTVATTTVEVLPDWAQDEDAKKAAQDVLNRKRLESRDEELTALREALKAEYEASDAILAAEQKEVQKELGTF